MPEKVDHLDHCRKIHAIFEETRTHFGPARYILTHVSKKQANVSAIRLHAHEAKFVCKQYLHWLLDRDMYEEAATMQWGPDTFTPDPHSTQLVWKNLRSHVKLLVQGGGSLSKSFSSGVFFGLDFTRDPANTSIKVISSTAGHAKQNIFAHMKNLLQSGMVEIEGLKVTTTSIMVGDDEKQGIHLVAIPQGDTGQGRLRGFHPYPRKTPHKKFGNLTRVAVLLDEAEEIPQGVWEEINNILITEETGTTHVRVFAATNPKDRTSRFAQEAEPVDGWASLDIERDEEWDSGRGWRVVRLDGAKCENVIEKRVVFPGLQTYEGFERLLKLGTDNPEYFTMARGWFPEASAQIVIITEAMFDQSLGQLRFSGPTISSAGVDLAFEGGDLCMLTLGRHGLAVGWTDKRGKWHDFRQERRAIQIEQQFPLEKKRTIEQSETIRRLCRDLGVKAPWLTCDRTGNGTGVHDALTTMMGPEVLGVHFGWAATDTFILEDDSEVCSELYSDIITEMAFACRRLMEVDCLKLNPGIKWNDLQKEACNRKYMLVGRSMSKLESKKDYKKRNGGKSPDRLDSLLLEVHGVRTNTGITAKINDQPVRSKERMMQSSVGIVDQLDFMEVSE